MGTAESTVGVTEVELDIYSRFKELELKFVMASSSATYPKLTSLLFQYNDLSEEKIE